MERASIPSTGGFGSLIKLLPTATVFFYQYANPFATNMGDCKIHNKVYKIPTSILLGICGFICFFSTFTDSYSGTDKKRHYGIVTPKGLWVIWPSDKDKNWDESSKYKLKGRDFVQAALSLLIFALLGLLDTNTVQCLYPSFESKQKQLLQILNVAVGGAVSVLFMTWPQHRHGIGYPVSTDESHATALAPQNPPNPMQSASNQQPDT